MLGGLAQALVAEPVWLARTAQLRQSLYGHGEQATVADVSAVVGPEPAAQMMQAIEARQAWELRSAGFRQVMQQHGEQATTADVVAVFGPEPSLPSS